MADGVAVTPGAGATIDTDELPNGRHAQRIKLVIGDDNADDGNLSSTNPMPVTGTVVATGGLTDTELRATAVPVSGPLTDTQLRATAVPVSGPLTDTQLRATAVPVSGTVTATGPLTDTQLRATAVPVSGTVTATGPLTDTQLRATAVPVSGPLTDTQLRATAVPVSGTVTATGPLTDTQLRATAVPVSGPLTDTQLRATAVPVTGTITAVTAITNALPVGTNNIGDVDVLTLPGSAHDAAISGNPIRIAGRAATAEITAVSAGDTCDLLSTVTGKLVTASDCLPGQRWSATGELTSATAVTIAAAAGSGIKNVITHVKAINSNGTTATKVQINDGAGGTAIWNTWCEENGGGEAGNIPPKAGTANTLLEIKRRTPRRQTA